MCIRDRKLCKKRIEWIPGECSVPCDDKCPDKNDPYKCGGIQTLTREIVVMNNAFGYSCALLARKRKCNQVKCPVDCKQGRGGVRRER